jgi:hypothetical protein
MKDSVTPPDWMLLRKIARDLGVSPKAFSKWRERKCVPHKWRIPIIQASGGYVSLSSFDAFTKDGE